ncbi:anti-sigma factor [Lentzea sp. NPDC058450]|uniref:anti-sigma factor n=1 Tax=Lentzea sp. NPDC058450 TaxID=3346505 RepID=UPI0036690CB7
MPHVDTDRLTLIALGDQNAYDADADHLRECETCAAELEALREVAALGGETEYESDLPSPSPEVWHRIAAETGQNGESREATPWWRSAALRVVAVAAVAAVAAGAAVYAADRVNRPVEIADQFVAEANLVALESAPAGASGRAQVLRRADAVLLRLDMAGMPRPEGLYQVWLYDGAQTMIPLGVLTGGQVDMAVPASIDITKYPIVDVSAQRLGQQEHGVSMLQGTLR